MSGADHKYGIEDAVRDVAMVMSLGLITVGLMMRSISLALIVLGSLILALVVAGQFGAMRQKGPESGA